MKILFICDPAQELKPGKETTLALIYEAQNRGFQVDFTTAPQLCLTDGEVIAAVQPITLIDYLDDYIHLGDMRIKNLLNYDLIVLRSNPNGYKRINTAYLLDTIADKVLISNDPRGIRELHGKYFISNFPDFIVPYAFVEHPLHLENFFKKYDDVVIKPVDGFGGHGVVRQKEKPKDIQRFFDEVYDSYDQSPFIVQPFIKEAVKGDKRIIMFDGEPVCCLLRVPQDADSLANITQGATIQKCELTLREQALCEELGPVLRDYGIFFAGVDMLGDFMTEVNVISVGTLVPANQLYSIKLENLFWDKLLEKHEDFHAA